MNASSNTETSTTTYDDMCSTILKQLEADGYTHYKGRAETFIDVVNAFSIIHKHNLRTKRLDAIPLISPTIKASVMGDTDFEFWTNKPIRLLQHLWYRDGHDLHRIIQTIKPIDKYDGVGFLDNTIWDEVEDYKP